MALPRTSSMRLQSRSMTASGHGLSGRRSAAIAASWATSSCLSTRLPPVPATTDRMFFRPVKGRSGRGLGTIELAALEPKYHEQWHEARTGQIEEAEHEEGCEDVCLVQFAEARDEGKLQNAKPSRCMRQEGTRDRDHEDAEHDKAAWIAGLGQCEIDER